MQTQIDEKFRECCQILKKGDILTANDMLNDLLVDALDNERVQFAVNCFTFWINIIKHLPSIEDPYDRGETLLSEWVSFLPYTENQKYKTDDYVLYNFKCGIFSLALENYYKLMNVQDFEQRAEISRKIGLCYKKLGEYETAKNCLLESNRLRAGVAAVIAELADCYALCGEDRKAKVLFREAFFIDAQKINLCFLDSELIQCLVRKIEDKGYAGDVLQEWIPVYGQLFGVFTVKRVLKPQEVSKLKQEIYALENELKDPSSNSRFLTPRLCTLYFWLIDHYAMITEENFRINEILTRIKILDPVIYEAYTK